jgi:hypothetical protein
MNDVSPGLDPSVLSALRSRLRGDTHLPGDATYDDARRM